MAALTPKRKWTEAQKRIQRYGGKAAVAGLSQYLLPAAAVTVVAAVAAGGFVALRNLIAGLGSGKDDGKGDKGGWLPSIPSAHDVGEKLAETIYDTGETVVSGAGHGVWDFFSGIWDAGQVYGKEKRSFWDVLVDGSAGVVVDDSGQVVPFVVPDVSLPPGGAGACPSLVGDAVDSLYDTFTSVAVPESNFYFEPAPVPAVNPVFVDLVALVAGGSSGDSSGGSSCGQTSSGVITSPAGSGGPGLDAGSGGGGTYPDSWYA